MPIKRRLMRRRSDAQLLDETVTYLDSGDTAELEALNPFFAASLCYRQAEDARAAWARGDRATACDLLASLPAGRQFFRRK